MKTKAKISNRPKSEHKLPEQSTYNPAFVEKILQGREDIKNGNGVKIDTKDLWK